MTAAETCTLSAQAISEDGVFTIVQPTKATLIEAGESVAVAVAFQPHSASTSSGQLNLDCDSGGERVSVTRRLVVPVTGLGGTQNVGNGDVNVEIKGDLSPMDLPSAPREKQRESRSRKPMKAPAPKEGRRDASEVELFDAGDYSPEDLGQRVLDKLLASLTRFDGALEIFGDVVSAPSKKEAARTSAGALAIGRVGDLLIKVAAKPLLSTLPGGSVLYETLKAGLSVSRDARGAGKKARQAATQNLLKDFTTSFRAQLTDARAQVESSRQEVIVGLRRDFARLTTNAARENRKLELFAQGSALETALSGELSLTSLFTKLVGNLMTQSTTDSADPNRLIIDLGIDWKLKTGRLKGPAGDRCAEKLMELHNGSLNVPMLGLPVQVRWHASDREDAYVSAWISSDGSVEAIVPRLVFPPSAAIKKMRENLKSMGIPAITRLIGERAS